MAVTHFPLWFFTPANPFCELSRELREMLYLNRLAHEMDAAPLHQWPPEHKDAPLDRINTAHLALPHR
jgi:hypothetical protein